MPYSDPKDLYEEYLERYTFDRPDEIHFDFNSQRQGDTIEHIDEMVRAKIFNKCLTENRCER
jgi:hypothetical protein